MFYDNPNIEKLSDKVFIYRNFIEKDRADEIFNEIKKNEANRTDEHSKSLIDWYEGKFSKDTEVLYDVWGKINELLLPEYCIHPQLYVIKTHTGDEMFVHSDSPGEAMEQGLTVEDKWNTCCVLHYGAIVYFGEWEGGEVFYPHIDKDGSFVGNNIPFKNGTELSVKPNPGDLIIHGALDDYAHGVKEITSGYRYAYSNFVLPSEKNPGTFPLYGTKENDERWEQGQRVWLSPIGFKWEIPENVKEELAKSNSESLPPNTFSGSVYPSELK